MREDTLTAARQEVVRLALSASWQVRVLLCDKPEKPTRLPLSLSNTQLLGWWEEEANKAACRTRHRKKWPTERTGGRVLGNIKATEK